MVQMGLTILGHYILYIKGLSNILHADSVVPKCSVKEVRLKI